MALRIIKTLRHDFIVKPYRLVISGATLLVPVLALVFIDTATDSISNFQVSFTAAWAFIVLPRILLTLLSNRTIILVGIFIYLLKSLLIPASTADVVRVYQHNRQSAVNSALTVSAKGYGWFLIAESLVYIVFGTAALAIYVLSYYGWIISGWNTALFLWLVFVLLYPLFYAALSVSALLSVVPLRAAQRGEKVRYLLRGKFLWSLYLFYFFRVGVETALVIGGATIIFGFIHSLWFATAFLATGVALPMAVIKGSSLEIKLRLFKDDPDMMRLFNLHYQGQ